MTTATYVELEPQVREYSKQKEITPLLNRSNCAEDFLASELISWADITVYYGLRRCQVGLLSHGNTEPSNTTGKL